MKGDVQLTTLVTTAVAEGMRAAALVDRDGHALACAGISPEDAMPLAALVMFELRDDSVAPRLFSGEVLTVDLEGRHVALAVAKRQLFLVVELERPSIAMLHRIAELRDAVASQLAEGGHGDPWPPPHGGAAGGAPSAFAMLDLHAGRVRAKA